MRNALIRVAIVTCAGATGLFAAPQQSPPQPVFTAGTDLVEVQAVVTDKKGNIVRGLAREDFQITEDGKPQDVLTFGFVDIPWTPPAPATPGQPAARAAAPDVATNVMPHERRVYVLVLDGFHVDSTRSPSVRKLARQFIAESIGPDDLTAVLLFGNNKANQPFTTDKSLLIAAVDQFIGQKSGSQTLNTLKQASVLAGGTKSAEMAAEDAEMSSKANQAQIMLASLAQVCESLGRSPGDRRSVILFSEGIEFDTTAMIGEDKRPGAGGQQLKHEASLYALPVIEAEQDMLEAARRANVAIYTIEPRGNTMGSEDIMQATLERDPSTGRPMPPASLDLLRESQRSQGSLRTFSADSGGIAVVGTDKFANGFTKIVQANSSYYALGYRPAVTPDSKFHKISVSVKSRGDVDILARQGYYALTPEHRAAAAARPADASAAIAVPNATSPKMKTLLASDLPVRGGIDLRLTGGPLRPQGDKTLVALVVDIDTSALPFNEQNGQLANDIEVAFLALDAQGVMQAGNRQVGNLRVPASGRDALTHGLRYVVEFPVAPGRYQVRVGVHESAKDGGGSALMDVEAPAFDKGPLALGTTLLTTPAAQSVPTTGSFPVIKAALPAPPTTVRTFAAGETISALVNVLGADVKAGVTLTTSVKRADGQDAFTKTVDLAPADLAADQSGYSRVVPVPLAGLAPGSYELAIAAKSASGRTAAQQIPFTIK
ncbi:MAG TPA: VWA domain-containing protein [Vicinamibacterales bacterium]|nr:VWA domain-containing protein [Vicinamibacterales bacterium]